MSQQLIDQARELALSKKPPIVVELVRQELEQREPDEPPGASRQ